MDIDAWQEYSAQMDRNDPNALLARWLVDSPFVAFLQLSIVSHDPETGRVAVRMPMRDEFERGGPIRSQFHGGPIAALIDTVGDLAVGLQVDGTVPTINFRVDFLRPASGSELIASATARKIGRSIAIADVDVHDGNDKLVAIGRGCYSAQAG